MNLNTRLAPQEHRWLTIRAAHYGLRPAEYLRSLVLADLQEKNAQTLLQTVEAEHTRLTLLAAQQGERLTEELLKELRDKAILSAPVIVERTVHVLKQLSLPVNNAGRPGPERG